ncbi:hypothetical protein LTR56_022530 [Elasticomyces elasticus]|nr:hypothetical protein LTR56_022530 [Elasticomyces elasticus]KAK3638961.1 hypothetical protein LTR22_017648 [Elasticomyces elasticus]KAK4931361.1 hypothetical protein LTR49_002062 [Elasticomyces elasticus]
MEGWYKRGGDSLMVYHLLRGYICRKTAKQQEQDGKRPDKLLLEGPEIVAADEAHNLKGITSMHDSNDSQLPQDDLLGSQGRSPVWSTSFLVDTKDVESSEKLAAVRNELLEAWTGRIMQGFVSTTYYVVPCGAFGATEMTSFLRYNSKKQENNNTNRDFELRPPPNPK